MADIVCFHCQQAAEKYLKAVLIQARIDFPKTHDLERLIELVKSTGVSVDELIPSAKMLTPFATDVRYSTVGIEEGAMEKAIEAMERFRDVFAGSGRGGHRRGVDPARIATIDVRLAVFHP